MNEAQTTATQVIKSLDEINFLVIAAIVVGAWLLISVCERLLPWMAERLPSRIRLHLLRLVPVLRLLILALAFAQLLPQIITPTSENLIALFGALGLAIGFALKEYASSLIGGIVTLYERPYRPGDWVQVDNAYGEVKSVGLRTMTMVTPDDTEVTIPHSKMWTSLLFNSNSGQQTQLCVADFYLHPRHDARRVRCKLRDVALTSSYLDLERPIAVVVSEKPWGTHYRLKAYPIDAKQQFQFASDLTVRGKEALLTLGVEPAVQVLAASGV